MAVYQIGWKATVYHNEFIEASSLEEAQEIAEMAIENAPDDWMYSSFDDSELYDIEACDVDGGYDDFEPTVSVDFLLGE